MLLTLIDHDTLVIWVCAGKLDECIELSRDACWWAKQRGLEWARFSGRKGWGRIPAVKEDGWVAHAPDFFVKEL